jgi:hypothetical protein
MRPFIHLSFLTEGSILERKSFIKSFIRRITVTNSEVTVRYTYPSVDINGRLRDCEVLYSERKSSPNATSNMAALMYSHSPGVNCKSSNINRMSVGCGERSLEEGEK